METEMMVAMTILSAHKKRVSMAFLFGGCYITIALVALKNYLAFGSLSFILGIVAMFFALPQTSEGKRGFRFAWYALAMSALCSLLPVSTFLYLAICLAIFSCIEFHRGRPGFLAFFTVLVMSPAFQYAVNTFSFPIRLQLSSIAGWILNQLAGATSVKGNVITYIGNEYSVDPGCMGLNMLVASLLLAVMLIGYNQHLHHKRVKLSRTMLYFVAVFGLNIIANLMRIIMLVHFNLLPGTMMHEVVGVFSILAYVFVPASWMARRLVKKAALVTPIHSSVTIPARGFLVLQLILMGTLLLLAIRVSRKDGNFRSPIRQVQSAPGYLLSNFATGILKLQGEHSLIYLKYIRGFYDTDHNPLVCWKGSGYEFDRVEERQFYGHTIYTGQLVDGPARLYTAWWYANGRSVTISQFDWRWDMLRGSDPYAVVNVTAETLPQLDLELKKLLYERCLLGLFDKKSNVEK